MSWLIPLVYAVATAGGPEAPEIRRVSPAPGETLSVVTAGSGAPVVLLPGLLGSAFTYRKVVPLLAEAGYRAIVIEPLGIGTSSRPRGADYSLTTQADRVAAVLDSLDAKGAIVAAHSLAATVALRLAYRRPDLVRAILALEGGAVEHVTTPGFRRAMKLVSAFKFLIGSETALEIIRTHLRRYFVAGSADAAWVTDETLTRYMEPAYRDLDAVVRSYVEMGDAVEPEPLAPRLAEVRCPVRLIVGTVAHTSRMRADEIQMLRSGLRRFAVDTLPGTGHFLFEERPEAVVAGVTRITGRAQGEIAAQR